MNCISIGKHLQNIKTRTPETPYIIPVLTAFKICIKELKKNLKVYIIQLKLKYLLKG